MNIGIDIVELQSLKKKVKDSPQFIEHILTEEECGNWELITLAGKIAVKEAIIKTGFIKPGEWKKVIISKNKDGSPAVCDANGLKITNLYISISHSENFAIAVAIVTTATN